MSLSPNLVIRHCPKCDRAILASSTRCQFCGSEVTPMAVPSLPSEQPGFVQTRTSWQETANAVLSILWITGASLGALLSLGLGPMGFSFFVFEIGMVFVGFGLYKQQWLAQMIGKSICFIGFVLSTYRLIGALSLTGMNLEGPLRGPSVGESLLGIVVFAFAGYVLWSVSD